MFHPGPATHPLLVLCVCLVAAVTLFPFNFQLAAPVDPPSDTLVAASPRPPVVAKEVLFNVLLFVPAGAVFFLQRRARVRPYGAIAAAGAAGLLLSGGIEGLQWLLPRRTPSLLDVASNTAGALAGAAWQGRWGTPLAHGLVRWRRRLPLAAPLAALAIFTAVVLLASWALQRESRPSDWTPEYPLLVGNERGGGRAWRGRLYSFRMSDAAASVTAMQQFAHGTAVKLPGSAIADFDFTGAPPYRDAAGLLPDLEWTPPRPVDAIPGAVTLAGNGDWLRTAGPAAAIATRVLTTGAFTLRLDVASDHVNQIGPARIVSNSSDVNHRNVSIGQSGPDMVIRVRTPFTGLNGSRPQVVVPNVFADASRRGILVAYDGATLLAAVSGWRDVHRTEFSAGGRLALAVTPSLRIAADELWMVHAIYLLLLLMAAGTLLRLFADGPRRRLVVGTLWVTAFAVLFEGTLVLASGRAFDAGNVAVTAALGVMVLVPAGIIPLMRLEGEPLCAGVVARADVTTH